MLGAGFVTRPTLEILSEAGITVTVGTRRISLHDLVYLNLDSCSMIDPLPLTRETYLACRTLASAQKLSEGIAHTTPISLDATEESALDAVVAQHDLVISLIPYTFHAAVIKSAIRYKKHVVTTSYVSPAMMALDAKAKAAGITVMNEIGLDPVSCSIYQVPQSLESPQHMRDYV